MNLADLVTLLTFIGCAVGAGIGSAVNGAGWLTNIFFIAGILLGACCALAVRWFAYALLHAKTKGRFGEFGSLIAYMFIPCFAGAGFVIGVSTLSAWIAMRIV